MSNQLEIKIESVRLSPEKFVEAATAFFGLVQGVAKNISNHPIIWTVEVDKGSSVVRICSQKPDADSKQSIDAVSRGVSALKSRIRSVPYGFTKDEVRAAKILAELADGTEIKAVFLKNGSEPERLTPEIAKSADLILKNETTLAFGSIEGRVVNISLRHAFVCTIREPIYRKEVMCYLQDDKTQQDALESVRIKARVLVSGLIHYNQEGQMHSIAVDKIELFPPQSELPTLLEIQDIYKRYK